MATSGDQEKGSSVLEETKLSYSCSPCNTDGKHFNAIGYCVNCKEYLCQRCFDVHLIPSLMRTHELLEGENMPSAVADADKGRISRACPQHDKEVINYYCPSHSFLGCHLCSYSHQKTCRDVLCIPEVCLNLTKTTAYKEFADKLAGFTNICMQTNTEFKGKLQSIESSYTKILAEIREFKKQLLDAVDNAEEDLVNRANTIKNEDLRKAKALNDKCNAILKKTQKITTMKDRLQGSEADLYIAMVKTRDMMKAVEDEISSAVITNHTRRVSFKANHDILEEFKKPWALGKLTEARVIETVEHKLVCGVSCKTFLSTFDVNIKSETDTSTCRPIGSVLCDNILLITDESNKNLKLVDTTSNKLTSELKLSSVPLGVCKISDDEVAVAEQGNVVFVKTGPPPRVARQFAISATFHGLGYNDNKLVLSYSSPPKVEVLDMRGNVLNTFTKDAKGQSLFADPYHLTVNPANKQIYVSNYSSHNVLCMTFDGTVVAKYTDRELQNPWQVITDVNGMVYVCGQGSHNIHQLTEDCRKGKVLLTNADGLTRPESISYDDIRGKLYVGLYNSNILKVYNVT